MLLVVPRKYACIHDMDLLRLEEQYSDMAKVEIYKVLRFCGRQ